MPVFQLTDDLAFPPVELAEADGLLALGGDLSEARLLLAYRSGIFPWYDKGQPVLWWSPDPRFVLFPERLKVARSMRPVLNGGRFAVTYDRRFPDVMEKCAGAKRRGQRGTWITPEMLAAYGRLHAEGYAHSVEVWRGEQLAGGLYGVALGACFFGESMFAAEPNASKFALIMLVRELLPRGFSLIDCQVHTDHLASLGAEDVPRADFLRRLRAALRKPTLCGNWGEILVR